MKRRDIAAETMRAVIEALRQALALAPEGCDEAALWRGLDEAGVHRATFDQAVALMLAASWARREGDRLHATVAIAPAPRPLVPPPDAIDETAERMGQTITIIGASRPPRTTR